MSDDLMEGLAAHDDQGYDEEDEEGEEANSEEGFFSQESLQPEGPPQTASAETKQKPSQAVDDATTETVTLLKAEGAAAFAAGLHRKALGLYSRAVAANEALKDGCNATASATAVGGPKALPVEKNNTTNKKTHKGIHQRPPSATATLAAQQEQLRGGMYDARMNATLKGNISLCHVKLGEYINAEDAARGAVKDDTTWGRGHQRLGLALMHQGKTMTAVKALQRCQELDPSSEAVAVAIGECRALERIDVIVCADVMDDHIEEVLGPKDKNINLKFYTNQDYHGFWSTLGDGTGHDGKPTCAIFWSIDFPPQNRIKEFAAGARKFIAGGGLLIHMSDFRINGIWENVFPKGELKWKDHDYFRTEVQLSPGGCQASRIMEQGLVKNYSAKCSWVKNVPVEEAIYVTSGGGQRQSMVFAADDVEKDLCGAAMHRHGKGALLFVGDVNFEHPTATLVKNVLKGEHMLQLMRSCAEEEKKVSAAAVLAEEAALKAAPTAGGGGKHHHRDPTPASQVVPPPPVVTSGSTTRKASAPGVFKCPSCLTQFTNTTAASQKVTLKCKGDRCGRLLWVEGDTVGLVATGHSTTFICPNCDKPNAHSQSDQFDMDCQHCNKGLRVRGDKAKQLFDYCCPACSSSMMHARPVDEVYDCPCYICGTFMSVRGEEATLKLQCNQCKFPVMNIPIDPRTRTGQGSCMRCRHPLTIHGPFVNGKTSAGKDREALLGILEGLTRRASQQ